MRVWIALARRGLALASLETSEIAPRLQMRGKSPILLPSAKTHATALLIERANRAEHNLDFNIQPTRILVVASNEMRIKRMIEACQTLERGHRMFLFADYRTFPSTENVFALQLI